jgi:hypothetical protein
MALLLPNSIFIHAPKTGGSWVRRILMQNALSPSEILCSCKNKGAGSMCEPSSRYKHTCKHMGIGGIPDNVKEGKLIFGFVRHPLSWYQSLWASRMQKGWPTKPGGSNDCSKENFVEYMEKRLKYFPCSASKMYETKLGSTRENIFIGKMENLREDLCTALDMAGEVYDPEIIHNYKKINVASAASEWKEQCYYTPEILERVLDSEKEAIERFGYTDTDVQKFLAPEDRAGVVSGPYENRTLRRPVPTIS